MAVETHSNKVVPTIRTVDGFTLVGRLDVGASDMRGAKR